MQEVAEDSESTHGQDSDTVQWPAEMAQPGLTALFAGPDSASDSNFEVEQFSVAEADDLDQTRSVSQHQEPNSINAAADVSTPSTDTVPTSHLQHANVSHSADTHFNSEDLSRQVALLQQQLDESQQRCRYLEALVAAHDSEQTDARHKHEQQARATVQQHQQQLKLHQQHASQQQSQLETAKHGADKLQQQLQASKQETHALQQQLIQQQDHLNQSNASIAGLQNDLGAMQQQLESVQSAHAAHQDKAASHLQQQLKSQQQEMHSTQQELQSAQAELTSLRSELDDSQQHLEDAQQQSESERQSFKSREAIWQQELQQHQMNAQQLHQVNLNAALDAPLHLCTVVAYDPQQCMKSILRTLPAFLFVTCCDDWWWHQLACVNAWSSSKNRLAQSSQAITKVIDVCLTVRHLKLHCLASQQLCTVVLKNIHQL